MEGTNKSRADYGVVGNYPVRRIDDIELFGFTERMLKYGYCDPSPFVRKVETFLELIGVYYKKYPGKLSRSPNKDVPYMNYKGTCVTGSTAIINFLRRYERELNPGITYNTLQQSMVHMITNTMEQSFFFCCLHQLYFHPEQWNETKKALGKAPTMAYLFVPALKKRAVKSILLSQGYGKLDADQVIDKGIVDLQCIEDCLGLYGEGPFFLGQHVTIVDITIFSFLVPIFRMEHEWKLSRLFATINQLRFPKLYSLCDTLYNRVCHLAIKERNRPITQIVKEVVEEKTITTVTKETVNKAIMQTNAPGVFVEAKKLSPVVVREVPVEKTITVETKRFSPVLNRQASPVMTNRVIYKKRLSPGLYRQQSVDQMNLRQAPVREMPLRQQSFNAMPLRQESVRQVPLREAPTVREQTVIVREPTIVEPTIYESVSPTMPRKQDSVERLDVEQENIIPAQVLNAQEERVSPVEALSVQEAQAPYIERTRASPVEVRTVYESAPVQERIVDQRIVYEDSEPTGYRYVSPVMEQYTVVETRTSPVETRIAEQRVAPAQVTQLQPKSAKTIITERSVEMRPTATNRIIQEVAPSHDRYVVDENVGPETNRRLKNPTSSIPEIQRIEERMDRRNSRNRLSGAHLLRDSDDSRPQRQPVSSFASGVGAGSRLSGGQQRWSSSSEELRERDPSAFPTDNKYHVSDYGRNAPKSVSADEEEDEEEEIYLDRESSSVVKDEKEDAEWDVPIKIVGKENDQEIQQKGASAYSNTQEKI